jgi:hypothetical protein
MSSGAHKIRDAVVQGLKAERTRAADRIFGNRTRPVWKDAMPVVLVFTREERAELFQVAPRIYRRTLSLAIVVVDEDQGKPDDLVDDRLDELADQVERFMFRDPRLGLSGPDDGEETAPNVPTFELETSTLESVDLVAFDQDNRPAERALAGQRITFSVSFLERPTEGRSEDLEPFRGANVSWKLKPGDDVEDARDRVELEGS